MSIKAKLIIGESERTLHNTNINYSRGTHVTGKPTTETIGGMVSVSFTPQGDEDDILNWMFADRISDGVEYPKCLYVLKKVEIVFYEDNYIGLELFRYKLEDCTCVFYSESFSNEWGMKTNVVFSAAIQYYKNDETLLLKPWQENWVSPIGKNKPLKIGKKEILGYYLTDLKGATITDYDVGDVIVLNIKTKNRIGEKITINLNDNDYDFKYGRNILENDILKNVTIDKDLHKVELKVITQKKEKDETN